jgi:hypothetical protein
MSAPDVRGIILGQLERAEGQGASRELLIATPVEEGMALLHPIGRSRHI